jgi:hypothetical protein
MLEPLYGLPGRIKILIDRLTATRAGNLDNLNATVSSRAPSSTALSSSVWTGTKAGYLDAAISGRASQASVDALPQGIIESIQRGTATTSGIATSFTATISAVNLSKSFVVAQFRRNDTSTVDYNGLITAKLTSTTQITFTRYNGSGSGDTLVEWQVIEYV